MQVELTIYDECKSCDEAEVEIMTVDTINDIRSLVAFCQHFDSRRYTIDANEYKEPVTTYEERCKARRIMNETEFTEEEIDFTMEMIRDLVPYDTPNYMQKVREMAIGCLRAERDPNIVSLCEEHDRMLEEGKI